jgi:hypothetical protein
LSEKRFVTRALFSLTSAGLSVVEIVLELGMTLNNHARPLLQLALDAFEEWGPAAHAQGTGGNGTAVPTPPGNAAGQPLNSDHLAPTGKTLPNPGIPQASGTTEFDRSIENQDDRIDESICKDC